MSHAIDFMALAAADDNRGAAPDPARRRFLGSAATALGGLVLGFQIPFAPEACAEGVTP
jgi:hypothetical protein